MIDGLNAKETALAEKQLEKEGGVVFRDGQIIGKVEYIPRGTAESIMNKIIYGNEKLI